MKRRVLLTGAVLGGLTAGTVACGGIKELFNWVTTGDVTGEPSRHLLCYVDQSKSSAGTDLLPARLAATSAAAIEFWRTAPIGSTVEIYVISERAGRPTLLFSAARTALRAKERAAEGVEFTQRVTDTLNPTRLATEHPAPNSSIVEDLGFIFSRGESLSGHYAVLAATDLRQWTNHGVQFSDVLNGSARKRYPAPRKSPDAELTINKNQRARGLGAIYTPQAEVGDPAEETRFKDAWDKLLTHWHGCTANPCATHLFTAESHEELKKGTPQ